MKIKLNPTKNFYINENQKFIRMGNFPKTGRMIEYEDDVFVEFLSTLKEFVEYDEVVHNLVDKFYMSKNDAENLTISLLSDSILVSNMAIDEISKEQLYNRELNYFLMLSNESKIQEFFKMCNKRICVLGIGGIGSIIAEMLVRAGFKNLILLDYDKVEKSNLIRQTLYFNKDIGKNKTTQAINNLKNINPNIKIDVCEKFVEKEEDLDYVIKNCDFVVSSMDKPVRKIRHIVNNVCVNNAKPVLFVGFAEHFGMVGPFIVPQRTACLECIDNKETSKLFKVSDTVPSFGPLCGIIANIAVSEIINYFINYKIDNLVGKTLMFDMISYKTEIIEWGKVKSCKICGGNGW